MGFFDGKNLQTPSKSQTKQTKGGFFSSGVVPIKPPKEIPKPTLGSKVGKVAEELGRTIASPVATMIARPVQAVAALSGVSDKSINEFSDRISKGLIAPTPKNMSDVKKDIGRGIETVALGIPAGRLSRVIGGGVLGTTAKLTPGAVKTAKTIGNIGADVIAGTTFGAGLGMEKGEDTLGVLKEAVIGGVTGGVGGQVLRSIGKKFFSKSDPTIKSTESKIPEIVPPSSQVTIPRDTIKTREAFDVADKLGYNFQQGSKILEDVVKKTGRAGEYSVDDIVEASKAYTPDKPPTFTKPATFQESPIIGARKPQPTTPKVPTAQTTISTAKQIAPEELQEATDVISRKFDDTEWSPTTVEQQYSRFKELQETDPNKLLRLATNSSETDTLRNNWALSFLENEAMKNGDIALSKQLSYSKVGSKAGGELVGGRFKDKDTIASMLREIRKGRAESINITEKKLDSKEKELFGKLKSYIKDTLDKAPTSKELSEIINDLICK